MRAVVFRGTAELRAQWRAWASVTLVSGMIGAMVVGPLPRRVGPTFFAARLGVASEARVPLLPLLVTVPVSLLAANAIAAAPGWVAGRLRPADVLRTE